MNDLVHAIADNKALARRILAAPVRLAAWRSEPDSANTSAVYVDVVYLTPRIDEPSLPATFTLSFKRSETRAYLKRGATAKIKPDSVARTEQASGTRTTQHEKSAAGSAKADFNLASPELRAAASAQVKGSQNSSLSEIIGKISVQHMPLDSIKGYSWIARPGIGRVLDGSPWSALEPRFRIYDAKNTPEPAVSDPVVEILNSALDLVIDSVEYRDRSHSLFLRLCDTKKNCN